MKDRVPRYPGRVTLNPVAGQANTYDMVRADQPIEAGTPVNKANLLPDNVASQYWPAGQVPAHPQVADVLGRLGGGVRYEETVVNTYLSDLADGTVFKIDEKGDGVLVDFVKAQNNYGGSGKIAVFRNKVYGATSWGNEGSVYENGPLDNYLNSTYYSSLSSVLRSKIANVSVRVTTTSARAASAANTKLVQRKVFALSADEIFYDFRGPFYEGNTLPAFEANALLQVADNMYSTRTPFDNEQSVVWVPSGINFAHKAGACSTRPMFTLPNDYIIKTEIVPMLKAMQDKPITIPASQIVGGTKIVTGNYVGTGTFGEGNPNSLLFGFTPRAVFIFRGQYGPAAQSYAGCFGSSFQLFLFGGNAINTQDYYGSQTVYTLAQNRIVWHSKYNGGQAASSGPASQMNSSGVTYYYVVIGGEE